MRNALATVGHMVIAVAIAAAVSVISLTAIGRVQWPAFPSSNQLHALTTVGQVGCILGLLCAGWVWRRGRGRTLARLLALVFVSAFSVVTLGMPLGATKLYLFGISVDQQFRTEYLTRLTDSSALHDMTYAGLPAFYPPGWFWIGGRIAALTGTPGWETFKRQLHLHHTAEDVIVWPALRERLTHSEHAQSVLDAMEAEHQQIDPLLAAVDGAFARADDGHRADARAIGDAADALARSLTAHLTHEERDGLPLIGEALTSAEWRGVGFKIVRKNGLSAGGEMFAWLADGADPDHAAAAIGTLPPPARLVYRAIWKPRYNRTSRWVRA